MQPLVGGGHEKYLTDSWSLVRPRGSKVLSPLLCLWNVHSAGCSRSGSRSQGQRLESNMLLRPCGCCPQLSPVKASIYIFFLRFWQMGVDFPCGSVGKESICGSGRSSTEWNGNSSVLAWKIPWTQEPDRLCSIVLQRVDTTEWLSVHTQVGAEIDLSHSQPRQASLCVSSLAC